MCTFFFSVNENIVTFLFFCKVGEVSFKACASRMQLPIFSNFIKLTGDKFLVVSRSVEGLDST